MFATLREIYDRIEILGDSDFTPTSFRFDSGRYSDYSNYSEDETEEDFSEDEISSQGEVPTKMTSKRSLCWNSWLIIFLTQKQQNPDVPYNIYDQMYVEWYNCYIVKI